MKVFQTPTGNSAEDEKNNKRHARRYRVYFIILAVCIAFLVILATTLTPMLVLQHYDDASEKACRAEEVELVSNYTTIFRDAVLSTISAIYGIQGYVMGEIKTLPILNGTKEERVAGQYFHTFDKYAELVNSSAEYISVFFTAPGGVTYQIYPKQYAGILTNWDIMAEDGYGPTANWYDPVEGRPTPWESIDTGNLALIGPYNTSSLPFVESKERRPNLLKGSVRRNKMWWIDLRQPVYSAKDHGVVGRFNFWGFALAALSVDHLLRITRFEETMRARRMNYTVFTKNTAENCIVIVSSWPNVSDCTVPFMRDFISAATVHDVLGDHLTWKVAVKSVLRENRLTQHVRVTIVLSSVLGIVVVFGFVLYIIILCTRVYDGTVHAPKLAPFAMLTVGPCRGEELWEVAPDQMVDVTDRLGKVLARQMVRHHAYQIQQVHPLTTSYVTRGVAAAVQMAFDTIEELQNSPIDDSLRHLLGDNGRLLLAYAVHWCNDAVVRLDPMGDGYRYEGPDVVYGGRMWVFAAPNVVTVSPTALTAATRISHVQHKLFDSVFLRGVAKRQDLYVLSDPTNHKLWEAEAVAAEQVRRARQTQWEMDEMKSSDVDPRPRRLTRSFNQNGYDSSDLDAGSCSTRPRSNSSDGRENGSGNWIASSLTYNPRCSDGHLTPNSTLRQRTAAAPSGTGNDSTVGVNAMGPTSFHVPASVAEAERPPPVMGTATASPFTPERPHTRLMVRRPNNCSNTSSPLSSSNEEENASKDESHSRASSPAHSDEDEDDALAAENKMKEIFVDDPTAGVDMGTPTEMKCVRDVSPYSAYVPFPPPLPPISSTQTTAAATGTKNSTASAPQQQTPRPPPSPLTTAVSPRRVLDTLYNNGATTTTPISSGPRYGEASSAKPLVMVPPSAELAAATVIAGSHGLSSKKTSSSPMSDGVVVHGRRGTVGPAASYDNPLAHNFSAVTAAADAVLGAASSSSAPQGGCATATSPGPRITAAPFTSDGDPLADSQVSLEAFSSHLLLRATITVQADHLLRTVFDRQAAALDVSYDSVRVLVYYFYSSYKILFRPLAVPERHNIYRRLVTAFGVPQQGFLEHLAARCAIRFLQQHEETQTLLWDQQLRLQAHAPSTNGPTASPAGVSDEAGNNTFT